MLVGKALVVHVNVARLCHCLCRADGFLQFVKVAQLHIRQLQQLIVIECTVLESALHHLFYLCLLQLAHHLVHIVGLHLRTVYRDDGAEVQEVAKYAAVFFCLLSCLCAHFCRLCQYPQRAVGCEVEGIALFLHASVIGKRCLHAEDSLHILGCGSAERTCHHEYCRPWLDAYSRGQPSATERDGIGIVGIFANGLVHHLQCLYILFVLVAIACYVDNLEHTEHGMIFQFRT